MRTCECIRNIEIIVNWCMYFDKTNLRKKKELCVVLYFILRMHSHVRTGTVLTSSGEDTSLQIRSDGDWDHIKYDDLFYTYIDMM